MDEPPPTATNPSQSVPPANSAAAEDGRLEPRVLQRLGRPAGDPGGGDALVGDDQHALEAQLGAVEADLVERPDAELQRRRSPREDGFRPVLGHGASLPRFTAPSLILPFHRLVLTQRRRAPSPTAGPPERRRPPPADRRGRL